ncbi:MAG: SET domain-containing protein-lysine N-methyltransferase [Verrucomicrobiae bacterium]|nr:SET domain-containing protein-lysine N-methyltransferase [Verrucomicrobiae bacterium]
MDPLLSATEPDTTGTINAYFLVRHSGIHGDGAFARCAVPAGTLIAEYTGERISKAESATRCEGGNPFIFTLDDTWDLDGSVPANPARFLNHSCDPNCEAQMDDDLRIWIHARRDIAPGEELTFNYGYDLAEWRDYPCRCGAPQCLGYIVAEEFHDQLRRLLAEIQQPPTRPA